MKSRDKLFREMMAAGPGAGSRAAMFAFAAAAAAGAAAFLVGLAGAEPQRAWIAYLTNFVFWSGLAFGSVLLSCCLTITEAHWGRPLKRLAEAPAAFLPVAFVLFWIMYPGRALIFPWINNPAPDKKFWLNADFLFVRDGLSFLALAAVAVALVYHSVKNDLERTSGASGAAFAQAGENQLHLRAQSVLAPVFGILFALVLSLLAFDLIMSLNPHWYSTLFGAYYFIGSFYTGLTAVMILSAFSIRSMGTRNFIRGAQLLDLGRLMFAFCICTADFFYCQFLIMWYGNMPEETRYVILRTRLAPWDKLSWTVLIVAFMAPFVILLRRKLKERPLAMIFVSVLILAGMWLERFLLVAPSIWKGETIPLGLSELLITAGFLGIMGLCTLGFLKRFPILPVGDPYFREIVEKRLDEEALADMEEHLEEEPLAAAVREDG